MTAGFMALAQSEYQQRLAHQQAAQQAADRRGEKLANGRVATFLSALILVGLSAFEKLPGWGFGLALLAFAGYVTLAIIHAKVITAEQRAKALAGLNQRGLDRLLGKWRSFSARGEKYLEADHLYAADLDVFGQGSLFQRLNETATVDGERVLSEWLQKPASVAEVLERQAAVKELAPRIDYRQRLLTEARMAGQSVDLTPFIAWVESPSTLQPIRWAFYVAHVLPPVTLGLYLASAFDLVPAPAWWVSLLLQIVIVIITRKRLGAIFEQLSLGEHGFVRFEDTFLAVDQEKFEHPRLQRLRSGLQASGIPVSVRLQHFERLFGFAALRASKELHFILNFAFLWDVHTVFRLDRWRATEGVGVRGWFDALAELEAFAALATWAFEHPDDAWPELDEGPVHFEAVELGHPLLDAPVRNPVELKGPGESLVITGSNMSGKTTFMRSMGINLVMALAGLPVHAKSLKASRAQVVTSMRVKDSLERGVSYFYAEVQRIKAVLDAAKANRSHTLFLLDELLMGTNTRERQIASKELMKALLGLGASGALTTHDLSLTELATETGGKARNVHFRDQMVNGEMTFDYLLRDGVVETSNALEVLRRAGVDFSQPR